MKAVGKLGPNAIGALWMLGSAVSFSCMATLVKYTGKDYSPLIQAFYRQFPAFLVMTPVMLKLGAKRLWTPHWKVLLYRAAASAGSMMLSFYAYQKMPLMAANALSFTRSLWFVPLAIFLLHEKVGMTRIAAAVVGFLGVLLMLGPEVGQGMSFGLPAMAMLGSAFLLATSVMGMKVISRDTSPAVIMIWSTILGTLMVLPGAIIAWRWPAPMDLALLSATGVCGLVAQGCYIKGFTLGDSTVMAPIDYTRLIFLAFAGYLLFHEIPTPWIISGGCIVVASTLALTWREQQLVRRAREAIAQAPEA